MRWLLWLALAGVALSKVTSERRMTFAVAPPHARVAIRNDLGSLDRYPVGRSILVKLPSAAFDLVLEAEGWKSERVPVVVNQFGDRWPARGVYQMQPDSLAARLSLWPRWPLLFVLLLPLAFRRRPEVAEPSPVTVGGIPWELEPGQRVAGYRVEERLGEGVTAVVYRVSSEEGPLALKLLKPEHFRNSEVAPRFRREMKALCRLRHPGIPYLMDYGEWQGMSYLVMELLGPSSLADTLCDGPLAAAQARPILRQICEALAFCHKQGIWHRDIKPENVMWAADGGVRVSDFGLSRPHDASTLTQEGTILGTPAYMAPEIVSGQAADAWSDQYSLGCLAYHMLRGRPPFWGDNPLAVLMQHLTMEPEPLEGELADWVSRLMRKAPAERFASMDEALAAL